MSWQYILKDELTNRIKVADINELDTIVREGNITASNGKVYSWQLFNTGLKHIIQEMDEFGSLERTDDMHTKIQDIFYLGRFFTRNNGLRERMMELTLERLKTKYPTYQFLIQREWKQ